MSGFRHSSRQVSGVCDTWTQSPVARGTQAFRDGHNEEQSQMKSRAVADGFEAREQEVANSEKTRPQLANALSLEEIRQLDDWLQAERNSVEKYRAR